MNRIVYLHGFASGPLSTKARFFGARFGERGVPFEVPDLAAGDFEHLTIAGQLGVVEKACRGERVTLIGSSMGGYLAALYAARHAEVERVVLLAPAFCFARRWADVFGGEIRTVFHYGEGRERRLDSEGLVQDAGRYEDYPDVRQPVLIFHGTGDTVVPAHLSETFAASHANVELRLLDSSHELGDVLDVMWTGMAEFLE
jgi:pimeloyl-ACP methyl ester carboxylesterase